MSNYYLYMCPLCEDVYDNAISSRPMSCFQCNYTICEQCKAEKSPEICEMCQSPAQFIINYTGVAALEVFKNQCTDDSILDIPASYMCHSTKDGQKCNEQMPNPRICVTCAEKQNLIYKNASEKWTLKGKPVRLIFMAMCSDCGLEHCDNNEDHTIMELFKVGGVSRNADELMWVYAMRSVQATQDMIGRCRIVKLLVEFKGWARDVGNWRKTDDLEDLKNDMKIEWVELNREEGNFYGDTFQKLRESKMKSEGIVEEACLKNERMRERIRLSIVDNIAKYIELIRERLYHSDWTDIEHYDNKNALKKFEQLKESLSRESRIILSDQDIKEIDASIETRLSELENDYISNSLFNFCDPKLTLYFKYQVIRKEAPKIKVAKEEIKSLIVEESEKRNSSDGETKTKDREIIENIRRLRLQIEKSEEKEEFVKNQLELISWQENLKSSNIVRVENSIKFDRLLEERLKVAEIELCLIWMKLRYFSIFPESSNEAIAFYKLLENDIAVGCCLVFFP